MKIEQIVVPNATRANMVCTPYSVYRERERERVKRMVSDAEQEKDRPWFTTFILVFLRLFLRMLSAHAISMRWICGYERAMLGSFHATTIKTIRSSRGHRKWIRGYARARALNGFSERVFNELELFYVFRALQWLMFLLCVRFFSSLWEMWTQRQRLVFSWNFEYHNGE